MNYIFHRNEGDMKANEKSLASGSGFSVVVRESKSKETGTLNYTSCHKCSGIYSNKTLYRHLRICAATSDPLNRETPKLLNLRISRMLMQSLLLGDSKYGELKSKVFTQMKNDEITNLIKNDEGVLLYGYHLYVTRALQFRNKITTDLLLDLYVKPKFAIIVVGRSAIGASPN